MTRLTSIFQFRFGNGKLKYEVQTELNEVRVEKSRVRTGFEYQILVGRESSWVKKEMKSLDWLQRRIQLS